MVARLHPLSMQRHLKQSKSMHVHGSVCLYSLTRSDDSKQQLSIQHRAAPALEAFYGPRAGALQFSLQSEDASRCERDRVSWKADPLGPGHKALMVGMAILSAKLVLPGTWRKACPAHSIAEQQGLV